MDKNETLVPKIGAFVLETLTTGMYTNPLDSLREYIQNAFDSIQAAERASVLSEGAGRIEVIIEEKKRNLRVRDNGMGVPTSQIYALLVNIGMSNKSIETHAGFRGIGRLAGIAYCDILSFRTQAYDENEISNVTFDCVKLRNAMSPKMRQVEELADVIGRYVSIETQKTRKNECFFEVLMEDINAQGEAFLEWSKIRTYLSQVAPVGFDTSSFALAGTIYDWLKQRGIHLPKASLVMRSQSVNMEVFKPYQKLTYKTKRDNNKIHIKGIMFYPGDAGPDSPFWIWYADTNLPGMFGDDTVGGIRLRKSNIGLGMGDRMTEIFTEVSGSNARFNRYLMGEVYVQDSSVIPNARRDGFEDCSNWLQVRTALIEFANYRSKEIRDASSARNIDVEKLARPAETVIVNAQKKMKTGFASEKEVDTLVEKIDKQVEKLETAKKSDRSEQEVKRIDKTKAKLFRAKKALEKETRFTAQYLNAALNKKQRKIISEIIGILYDVLEERVFEKARDAILAKYQIQKKDEKA